MQKNSWRATRPLCLRADWIGRNVVVAIEFQFVERCGDTEPPRHGGGLNASYARFADDDHVAAAHRTADENDFKFDQRSQNQLARAEEENTARTDVARDQGDRKIFGEASDTAEAQWEPQGSSGILALFGENTDGMSRHAGEATHGIQRLQRHYTK